MRRTSFIMGMPITIDVPALSDEEIIKNAFKEFDRIDRKFSTYKTDSEVARFRNQQLEEVELSKESGGWGLLTHITKNV
jgi:thiamine biosynthesis lipoprotein